MGNGASAGETSQEWEIIRGCICAGRICITCGSASVGGFRLALRLETRELTVIAVAEDRLAPLQL